MIVLIGARLLAVNSLFIAHFLMTKYFVILINIIFFNQMKKQAVIFIDVLVTVLLHREEKFDSSRLKR
jgi:hypothetical protein